jgi:hypothetical protein
LPSARRSTRPVRSTVNNSGLATNKTATWSQLERPSVIAVPVPQSLYDSRTGFVSGVPGSRRCPVLIALLLGEAIKRDRSNAVRHGIC